MLPYCTALFNIPDSMFDQVTGGRKPGTRDEGRRQQDKYDGC